MSVPYASTDRLTVEAYEELGRTGVLDGKERVELLHGEIILMSPIGYRHATAVDLLGTFFIENRRGRYAVRSQNPFNLDPESQPQPDLMLVHPAYLRERRHPRAEEVFLTVEVSDATVRYDREDKGRAYAAQMIAEYWLLNLERDRLEVYREPGGSGFRERIELAAHESMAPLAFPDLVVRVSDFLP